MLLFDAYKLYIDKFATDYYESESELSYHRMNRGTWCTFRPRLEVNDVTPPLFMEWRERLIAGRLCTINGRVQAKKRTTVKRHHQTFMRAMTWLTTMGYMSTEVHYRLNLVPYLKAGRSKAEEPDPPVPLNDELLDMVIEHCNNEAFRELLRLIRHSGMRPGEACKLRKEDIDKDSVPGVWLYHCTEHKTKYMGKQRIVFFGPKCQEIIARFEAKKRLEPGPLFRNDRGRPHTPHQVWERIQFICEKHGIPKWKPSQIRKSRSNEVYSLYGEDGEKAMLGHTAEVARRYYLLRDLRTAAEIAREIG